VQYETEEQQVEALKEWWDENGRAVILGIVLGAAVVFAWIWWQNSQEKKAVAASDNFALTMEALASGDHAKVTELAAAAKSDHDGTLYASYTNMAAARSAVEAGNLDEAATHLQWVVDNAELEEVGVISRVRLARVKAAQGDADAGLGVLPSSYAEQYTALVEEARGDLHIVADDLSAAKAAFQKAFDTNQAADAYSLKMKLDELAAVGG